MGSCRRRCQSLLHDLQNSYAKVKDEWPDTLNESHALLCNWRTDRSVYLQEIQDDGISFYKEDGKEEMHAQPRGNRRGFNRDNMCDRCGNKGHIA
mmetsp:Transcript_59728/g.176985  ORF Transcript_59728/g.176985 Transcript_59728/m.176985 type:complete len:95 (+) Transcript_59728:435-719(+)